MSKDQPDKMRKYYDEGYGKAEGAAKEGGRKRGRDAAPSPK
jgi:hypothetical protein